jgi:hypothetical protein
MAVALSSGSVLAQKELGHHGKVGQHSLNEANGDVVCHYDPGTANLTSISVRAPTMFARDRTAGVDAQDVGWRIFVQRKLATETSFKVVKKSSTFKAPATDVDAASFKSQTVTLTPPENSSYRIVVKMTWYRADGSVAGWSKHRVEAYTEDNSVDTPIYPGILCTNRYGV